MDTCSEKGKLNVSIEFLGATNGVVTGSANLVTITRGDTVRKVLVDYGWFQGDDDYMNEDRVIDPDEVDCVLLTHAHLDHCGGIPLLFKPIDDNIPFTGKIYGSRETLDQATHILRDSAKVNENRLKGYKGCFEKAKHTLMKDRDKAEREDAKPKEIAAFESAVSSIEEEEQSIFYSIDDVDEAIRHFYPIDFTKGAGAIQEITLFEGIDAKFIPTSHINGSTMIELKAYYGNESYTIVFTGDIGNENTILYKKMRFPTNYNADCIVLESLHGVDKPVESLQESTMILKKILKQAARKQKSVIISAFSLDRSAGLIKILNDFMDQGLFLQCFIDSPLTEKELTCYINSYKDGTSAWFNYNQGFPFKTERFHTITTYQEHLLAAKYKGPNVFITSSCMGFGGRVLDYFEQHIQSEDSIFIFPGFLPQECPSKTLLEAEQGEIIELNGRRYKKHCKTIQLHGFSSHGYYPDKLKILDTYPNAGTIFLNHGDNDSLFALNDFLAEQLEAEIIIPEYEDCYKLL